MFILTTILDLVEIKPTDFRKPSIESIEDNLNAKFSNRVVLKNGLGICVWDILKTSDGQIGHGTGKLNINVEFRLLVFRPFKGEIISGRITSASEAGMKIGLDFFDDIYVPNNLMFEGSYFNVKEQVWVWPNGDDEYYYDKHEWVRVRVEEEHWHDNSPAGPQARDAAPATDRKSPYTITGSMMQSGLGPTLWW